METSFLLFPSTTAASETSYLQGQQAAVDLVGLHHCGAVTAAADVRAPLVPGQVDQRELSVQGLGAVVASQDNLEDGVGAGRVGIRRRVA